MKRAWNSWLLRDFVVGAGYVRRSSISTPLTYPACIVWEIGELRDSSLPHPGIRDVTIVRKQKIFLLTPVSIFRTRYLIPAQTLSRLPLQFSAVLAPGMKTFGVFGDFDISSKFNRTAGYLYWFICSLAFAISQEFPSDDRKTRFCWSCENGFDRRTGERWGAWDRRFVELLLVRTRSATMINTASHCESTCMRTDFRTHVIILTVALDKEEQIIQRIDIRSLICSLVF